MIINAILIFLMIINLIFVFVIGGDEDREPPVINAFAVILLACAIVLNTR